MVVAPITWISPRDSGGFKMAAASMEPSAEPAPMSVCISSMNRMISPASITSLMHFFRRSSNSPRYFDPATSALTSSVNRRLPRRMSGTWFDTMSCARPSATAVLPTPGSPMSSGLFFWRRLSTCMTRSISPARPITGSSLPSRAFCVRSVPNSFSTLSDVLPFGSNGLRPA